jgi:hypothetical protein
MIGAFRPRAALGRAKLTDHDCPMRDRDRAICFSGAWHAAKTIGSRPDVLTHGSSSIIPAARAPFGLRTTAHLQARTHSFPLLPNMQPPHHRSTNAIAVPSQVIRTPDLESWTLIRHEATATKLWPFLTCPEPISVPELGMEGMARMREARHGSHRDNSTSNSPTPQFISFCAFQ